MLENNNFHFPPFSGGLQSSLGNRVTEIKTIKLGSSPYVNWDDIILSSVAKFTRKYQKCWKITTFILVHFLGVLQTILGNRATEIKTIKCLGKGLLHA